MSESQEPERNRNRLLEATPRGAYVELRTKSAFSFLRGASLPEDLVARASALGYDTLALADLDGLYGAPRFYQAAAKAGLRAIVGADLEVAGHGRVLLLVRDRAGYQGLSRLITRAKGRVAKEVARDHGAPISLDELAEHAAGLLCLTGGPGGILTRALAWGGAAAARECVDRLRDAFGAHVFAELQCHHDPEEAETAAETLAFARATGLPLVATNDVRYATLAEAPLADVLTCIHERVTLDGAGRLLMHNAERHLKSPAEMAALFAELPSAIAATRRVAELCQFTLADLGYRFPHMPVPAGATQQSELERLTRAGAQDRYARGAPGPLPPPVEAQLSRELQLIAKLDLAGYFLIVWDLVRYCREQGILVQGRGSAANSAVCYALGITAVDPVGLGLLFERFLSEERGEWPDIDLDLPSGDRREMVIQYVYQKYGKHGSAMTANVITYRGKSAARDVGKALGFSTPQLDKLSGLMSSFEYRGPGDDNLPKLLAAAGFDPEDRRVRLFGVLATQILGLPRHLGQHSGGMVMAAGRLDEVVPLEPASMPGRVVVQWDKDDCSDLGLIKVDLLGLGMMALLEEAVPLVRAHDGVELDLAHLPQDDPAVYDMCCAADTVGVFQIESRAQMATLPRMKPRSFYDLAMQVAIIRPGPIVGQMVNPFLERRNRRQPVSYPHPDLEPVLARTLGVPLFQEQLMRMAMVVAGFTGGQAEELRRAMGFKRSAGRMRDIEKDLRAGMAARGMSQAAADQIVQAISSFALYGFPESHALSFALIVYASAYLKCHHPAVFTTALLNNWPMGFYHPATIVKDAQRHGVRVLPIDVTASTWKCSIVKMNGRNAVRLGLRYVKGLREAAGQALVAARAEAPLRSIADATRRAGLLEAELETLAEIGAFTAIDGPPTLGPRSTGVGRDDGRVAMMTRREALWQVQAAYQLKEGLFAAARLDGDAGASPLPEMDAEERAVADFRGTSMTVGPHPMKLRRAELARAGVVPAGELSRRRHGEWVKIGGAVIVRQRPGTAKCFVFVTLEDETGIANAIVTPQIFEQHRAVIITSSVLLIEGPLQVRDGTLIVKAQRFTPGSAAAGPDSHDFH